MIIEFEFLEEVIKISIDAGYGIMKAYDSSYDIVEKSDGSPVTIADQNAHNLIYDRLQKLAPGIPLVSEESNLVDIENRLSWERFWLVDPLDGTKEFIKKNGEFTVNIAMIEGGRPILGVVHAPARDLTYFATSGKGSWRQIKNHAPEKIMTKAYHRGAVRMTSSRSHRSKPIENFCLALEEQIQLPIQHVTMGSSLKFCLVAEGSADIYPRLGPTSEWDTGAAHCVLEEAGGSVRLCDGGQLMYNKESLLNPWFVAMGDPTYQWLEICPIQQS